MKSARHARLSAPLGASRLSGKPPRSQSCSIDMVVGRAGVFEDHQREHQHDQPHRGGEDDAAARAVLGARAILLGQHQEHRPQLHRLHRRASAEPASAEPTALQLVSYCWLEATCRRCPTSQSRRSGAPRPGDLIQKHCRTNSLHLISRSTRHRHVVCFRSQSLLPKRARRPRGRRAKRGSPPSRDRPDAEVGSRCGS